MTHLGTFLGLHKTLSTRTPTYSAFELAALIVTVVALAAAMVAQI
ncbi:hypothetical protein [Rhizobium sp. CFBP 8762]|nr:hypothetical protein [Rhizobium sp. CFBP 8762]